jgi:hypothetical protein
MMSLSDFGLTKDRTASRDGTIASSNHAGSNYASSNHAGSNHANSGCGHPLFTLLCLAQNLEAH